MVNMYSEMGILGGEAEKQVEIEMVERVEVEEVEMEPLRMYKR